MTSNNNESPKCILIEGLLDTIYKIFKIYKIHPVNPVHLVNPV